MPMLVSDRVCRLH